MSIRTPRKALQTRHTSLNLLSINGLCHDMTNRVMLIFIIKRIDNGFRIGTKHFVLTVQKAFCQCIPFRTPIRMQKIFLCSKRRRCIKLCFDFIHFLYLHIWKHTTYGSNQIGRTQCFSLAVHPTVAHNQLLRRLRHVQIQVKFLNKRLLPCTWCQSNVCCF